MSGLMTYHHISINKTYAYQCQFFRKCSPAILVLFVSSIISSSSSFGVPLRLVKVATPVVNLPCAVALFDEGCFRRLQSGKQGNYRCAELITSKG
ncbi:hypothetical protein ACHQM5_009114 [Ranunculus cassubicifolius]